jgi:hypothetical protein
MSESPVAAEVHQALDALLNFATSITFDLETSFDGVGPMETWAEYTAAIKGMSSAHWVSGTPLPEVCYLSTSFDLIPAISPLTPFKKLLTFFMA